MQAFNRANRINEVGNIKREALRSVYPYGEGRLAVGGVRMSMLAWNWS